MNKKVCRLKSALNKTPASGPDSVSILQTVLRTLLLVGMTLLFASAFRFWQPAINLAQRISGTNAWQSLYSLFRIDSGLGREQLILTGIIVACFCFALIVQMVGLFLLQLWHRRRS